MVDEEIGKCVAFLNCLEEVNKKLSNTKFVKKCVFETYHR